MSGRPAGNAIEAVVEVWCDALWSAANWNDERNINRLQTAFKTASAECNQWPAPVDIRKRMPAVVTVLKALPEPLRSTAQQQEINAIIEDLLNSMKMN
ncbi:MAG: hypothetical protein ACWIPH_05935 [Ostreibacterium sp.]